MSKVIYTDHAYERMYLRNIPEPLIQSAVAKPDQRKAEADGDTQFIKNVQRREVHVVAAKLPKEGKDTWLIKTVWIRGEDDPSLPLRLLRMLMMRLFHRKRNQR